MPTTVNVDEFGIASFRKSLYDEEGDAIDLVAVEVVEIDGNPVAEGPDRTPAWLTEGYATVDEETDDGPLGSRRYLHLDFSIDTEHATIEKNTSYKIRVRADDNFNPEQSFDFIYTNGVLDFSTLTGLTGLFTQRLQQAPAPTNTFTNFGSGDDMVGTGNAVPVDSMFDGRGAFRVNNDTYSASGLLPIATGVDPFSVWLFFANDMSTSSLLPLLEQMDSVNGFSVSTEINSIRLVRRVNGVQTFQSGLPVSPRGELTLLELHRDSTGHLGLLVNGAEVYDGDFAVAMPDTTMVLNYSSPFAVRHLAELITIDGELTEAQKTQVRKALKALYPMSLHEVT